MKFHLAALACPALLLVLAACSKADPKARSGPPPVPVHLADVVKKDMPIDLTAIGNVEAIATVAIKAQVGGELIEVHFAEGQDVKAGDLLFTIDPKVYATQLDQAEANLSRDRVQAANALREFTRNSGLGAKGAVSGEVVDQSRATSDALAATVKADEAALEIAKVQLGYTTIRSPLDGRTGALGVQRGNLVSANSTDALVTVNQLAPIYVTFAIPEESLAAIRRELAAGEIRVTALDPPSSQPLGNGKLTFMSNTVDATTGTILLKATFPNDDRALWPGAFVNVVLHLSVEKGTTVVPARAVTLGQKGAQLFIAKPDGTVELRPAKVGRTVGDETIILAGAQPGDQVVSDGQSRLIPGSKIVAKP